MSADNHRILRTMNNTDNSTRHSLTATGLFISALALVLLVELIGNLVVLGVVYRQRKNMKQRVTNTLLANLAFIDLLVPTFLIPFSLTVLLEGKHVLTFSVCQLNGFVSNVVGSASILTMAIIGLDRYLAIVSPCGRRLQYRHAQILLLGVWVISVLISLLPIIFWGQYKVTKKSTTCKSEDMSYLLLLGIVCFVIPLATMFYCYTKVFLKVRRHKKLLDYMKTSNSTRRIKTEFKTTKIVLVVLTSFIIAWTPFVIVYIISSDKIGATVSPTLFQFFGFMAATHSMCNPIIYFTMNKAFRRDALNMAPCTKQRALAVSHERRSTHNSYNRDKRSSSTPEILSSERLGKDNFTGLETIPLD